MSGLATDTFLFHCVVLPRNISMLWVVCNGFLVLSHSQYFLFVSEGAKLTSEGSGCGLRDQGNEWEIYSWFGPWAQVLFTLAEADKLFPEESEIRSDKEWRTLCCAQQAQAFYREGCGRQRPDPAKASVCRVETDSSSPTHSFLKPLLLSLSHGFFKVRRRKLSSLGHKTVRQLFSYHLLHFPPLTKLLNYSKVVSVQEYSSCLACTGHINAQTPGPALLVHCFSLSVTI